MPVTIYFDQKPLLLTTPADLQAKHLQQQPHTAYADQLSDASVKQLIHDMSRNEITNGIFLHADPEAVLNLFRKALDPILAAGGFVHQNDGTLLLIFRRGKWDLPKGKLDEGESLETCALREVEEETGLKKLDLQAPLFTTFHTYQQWGKHILKESHWFLIGSHPNQVLRPQTDEDIEECRWVPFHELPAYEANMHASLRDVVQAGLQRMKP